MTHRLLKLMEPERRVERIILKSFLHPIDVYAKREDLVSDTGSICLMASVKRIGTKDLFLLQCTYYISNRITIDTVYKIASKTGIRNKLHKILSCEYCYLGNTVENKFISNLKKMLGEPKELPEYTRAKQQLQILNRVDIQSLNARDFAVYKTKYQKLRTDIGAMEKKMQINIYGTSSSPKCHGMTPVNYEKYCGYPLEKQVNPPLGDRSDNIMQAMMLFLERCDWEEIYSKSIILENKQELEEMIGSEETEYNFLL